MYSARFSTVVKKEVSLMSTVTCGRLYSNVYRFFFSIYFDYILHNPLKIYSGPTFSSGPTRLETCCWSET